MNRHYVLPICFAAAAHGALLLGFTKHPRPPMALVEKTVLTPFAIQEIEKDIPTLADTERSESVPKNAPDEPKPLRTPEPLVEVDFRNVPVMERPEIQFIGMTDMREVLDRKFGVPGSDGDDWRAKSILPSGQLDASPRTRFQAAPAYPFEAKRDGISGEVHVDFIVDERGRVVDPRVVRSTNRIFDEATLRAVAKWQFEPGRRHGSVVRFRMMVPVMFNLNEGV